MSKILVGRHEHGICLNPVEYLLDGPDGEPVEFNNQDEAIDFLRANCENPEYIQDDIDNCSILFVDAETREIL